MTFSIIIPVHNIAAYLHDSLNSLIKQSFTDWEAICIDDGSKDESPTILDEYAAKDSRFKVLHQVNAGVSAARNAGLNVAKGDWILYLDGDDAFSFSALETLNYMIQNKNVDLIFFGHKNVKVHEPLDANFVQQDALPFDCYDLNDSTHAKVAFKRIVGSLLAWNGCFRKSSLGKIRFELGMPNGEDVLYGTTCFCHSTKVIATSLSLYHYLDRAGSAAKQSNLRHLDSSIRATIEVTKVIASWGLCDVVRRLATKKIQTMLYLIDYDIYSHLPEPERPQGRLLFATGVISILKVNLFPIWIKVYSWMAIKTRLSTYLLLRMPWLVRKHFCRFRTKMRAIFRSL